MKSGYGLDGLHQRQEAILLRAIEMAKDMRAISKSGPYKETFAKPKRCRLPFQVLLIYMKVNKFRTPE